MSDYLQNLDTPIAVIDLDVVERNILHLQSLCNARGIRNTPHFKTHKSIRLARMQMEAGAAALCCQKLGEAEVLAEAGIKDIIITYNIIGSAKSERLRTVAEKSNLTLFCDNHIVADFLSQTLADTHTPVSLLVECDTGQKRSGVCTPEEATALASYIDALPGVLFDGLAFYPPVSAVDESVSFLKETRRLCNEKNLEINRISSGGTPGLVNLGVLGEGEYRAGTCVFNDRMMMGMNAATLDDCALSIYATLTSNAEPGRGIVDAGSKTLTSDKTIFSDFGYLPDYPDAKVVKQAEEHGFLDISNCKVKPRIGEILRVIPNHVCPVINLMDTIPLVRNGELVGELTINARGKIR